MSRKTGYILGIIGVVILSVVSILAWNAMRASSDDSGTDLSKTLSDSQLDDILLEEQEFVEERIRDDSIDTEELRKELPVPKETETPGEESVDPHLRSAKELIKSFHIDEAIKELILADETAEKYYYQGLLYAYQGKSEEARTHFEQAKLEDGDASIVSAYADKYLETYRFFDTFQDATPEYLDTLISKDFLSTGELQLGIAKLKYIVSVEPDYDDAHILLGSAYMVHGNFPKAIETLTNILPTERGEVYYWLGLAYYYDNNVSKSIVAYKQAVNKGFEPAFSLYEKIADAYLSQKNYESAVSYYTKAIEEPEGRTQISMYIRPVWIYNDILKKPTKGLELSEIALQNNQESAMAQNLMGWSYISLGQYEEALDHLEFALDIDPELPAAHLNLGILYKEQEEYDRAKEYFKEAQKLDDGSIGTRAQEEYAEVLKLEEQKPEPSIGIQ